MENQKNHVLQNSWIPPLRFSPSGIPPHLPKEECFAPRSISMQLGWVDWVGCVGENRRGAIATLGVLGRSLLVRCWLSLLVAPCSSSHQNCLNEQGLLPGRSGPKTIKPKPWRKQQIVLATAHSPTYGIPAEQGWVRNTFQDMCAFRRKRPDAIRHTLVKIYGSSSIDF